MTPRVQALLVGQGGVCSTGQLVAAGLDEADVARLVRSRELVRLRRGSFAAGAAWATASPESRLRMRTVAMLIERPGAAASHGSAAVIHGLPLWDVPGDQVHLLADVARRRTRSGVTLHPGRSDVPDMSVGGLPVVPAAVAIAQVVAEHGVVSGLVCLDRALHDRLTTPEAVAEAAQGLLTAAARRRVAAAAALADPRCESVGETRARLLLGDLGFEVRSQVAISDGSGRFIGRVDFLVERRVVIEFDGMTKYAGSDGRLALQAEKQREDRLRAEGYVVVRLVWADLDDPVKVLSLVRRAIARAA